MYSRVILTTVMFFVFVCANSQTVKVHLEDAGTLESKIERTKYDKIKELVITGYVNGFDLNCIRDMDNLEILDLTGSTIVKGGIGGTISETENNTIRFRNFARCDMRTLKLPSTLLYITANAFYEAYRLETLELGSELLEISDMAFVNPQNSYEHSTSTSKYLKEIIVSPENKRFSSENGVMYDKNKTTLLFYPNKNGKKYVVPESVTHIRARAFSCCSDLFELTLSESLIEIGQSAFENCEHLLSIKCKNPVPPITVEGNNGSVFYKVPVNSCILYVPQGSYSDYWMAPGWGSFENIVEYDKNNVPELYGDSLVIYKCSGGLFVNNICEENIYIYSFLGNIVYNGRGGVVPLSPGFYMVKSGNAIKKICVE